MSRKNLKKNIKIVDFLIILAFFCTFFMFFSKISQKNINFSLYIYSEDQIYEYDLSKNTSFVIKNSLGEVSFTILEKQVFVTNSTCKNKTCVNCGAIKSPNTWLCCAPNKIFAIIKAREESTEDFDAVAF